MTVSWLRENPAGVVVIATTWPICAVATLIVVLRFYARKLKRVGYGADDYLMVIGLLGAYGCCGCSTACVRYGIGKHIAHVSQHDLQNFYRVLFAYNQIYIATAPSIKISILLMYKRIFSTPRFKMVVNVTGVLVFIWYLAEAINGIFGCRPVQGFWSRQANVWCEDFPKGEMRYAIINIGFDAIILAFPVRMILKLQLSRVQKIALIAIFLLGAFNIVAVICRLLDFIIYADSPDFTWTWYLGLIWTIVEPCVGVISGCLPLLNPILVHIFPKGFTFCGPISPLLRVGGGIRLPTLRSRQREEKRKTLNPPRRHSSELDDEAISTARLHVVPLERIVIDDAGNIQTHHTASN